MPPIIENPVLLEIVERGLIVLDQTWTNHLVDAKLADTMVRQILAFIKADLPIENLIPTLEDSGVLMSIANLKEIVKLILDHKIATPDDFLEKVEKYYDILLKMSDAIPKDDLSKPDGMSGIHKFMLATIVTALLVYSLYLITQ